MFLITKIDWEVPDLTQKGKKIILPAGRHEVERVPNPFGHEAPWLMVKGTNMGACEGFWRDWQGGEFGDYQIIVEEG